MRRICNFLVIIGLFLPGPIAATAQIEKAPDIRYDYIEDQDTLHLRMQMTEIEALILENPDQAIHQLDSLFSITKGSRFYLKKGAIRLYQGNAYLQKNDYAAALSSYKEAIFYLRRSEKGSRSIPSVLNNIANVYHQMNESELAMTYFYKAIFFADSMSPPVNVDYIYQNLAGMMVQLNHAPVKIMAYLDKAERFAKERKNYSNLASNYNNRGYAYKSLRLWDSSLVYFHKSYQVARTHGLLQGQYVALLNLGSVCNEMSDFGKAMSYFKKAEEIQADITPFFRNRLYKGMGVALTNLRQYDTAEKYLLQAMNGSLHSLQSGILLYVYHDLADLYARKQEFHKAYRYLVLYTSMNDSIAHQNIINKVNVLESKFSVARKNEEIARKELLIQAQDNRIRNKNLLVTFALVSAAGLLLFILFSTRQRKRIHSKNMQNLRQQQEIALLQAHISGEEKERARIARELHDGLGGLCSALSLNIHLLKNETEHGAVSKVYPMVEHILDSLHSEIKKTAHNLTPDILIQHSLEESVLLYCRQVADAAGIDLVVQAVGQFDKMPLSLRLTIYRIIQELVNNIVKHAQATKALVQLVAQEQVIAITVEDNGVGFDTSGKHTGMGLENIAARVQALQGQLTVESAPGEGTTTIIELYN